MINLRLETGDRSLLVPSKTDSEASANPPPVLDRIRIKAAAEEQAEAAFLDEGEANFVNTMDEVQSEKWCP